MKTEYDAYAAFLDLNTGRTGTPLFYAIMLRNISPKSLATSGFAFIPKSDKTAFYRVTNPQPSFLFHSNYNTGVSLSDGLHRKILIL